GVGEVRATEREVGGGGGQDGRGRAREGRRVGPRAVVHGRERPHGIDRVGHELLGGAGRGVGERCEGGGERQRGVIEAAHARVGRRHERARRRGGGRRRARLGARTSPVARVLVEEPHDGAARRRGVRQRVRHGEALAQGFAGVVVPGALELRGGGTGHGGDGGGQAAPAHIK